ncbi:MAG: hypothetical protein WC855_13035 [Thermodesulfovibrionales bacterium]
MDKENNKLWLRVFISGICLVILASVFAFGWGIEAGLPKSFVKLLGINGTVAFFSISGFSLIIYSLYRLQKTNELSNKSIMKYLSIYYSVRFLAGLLFMGSFGIAFIVGTEYGLLVGLISFILFAAAGIVLHLTADKIR